MDKAWKNRGLRSSCRSFGPLNVVETTSDPYGFSFPRVGPALAGRLRNRGCRLGSVVIDAQSAPTILLLREPPPEASRLEAHQELLANGLGPSDGRPTHCR
ncbi:MAG: hypothetical protein ACI835_005744 [Planctomycetota bacterium]